MEDLDRGATGICGKGMYSGQEKTIIFCVVNKKEIVRLKELVDDIDPTLLSSFPMQERFMEKGL